MSFVPDFHEKEEAFPLVYGLGRVSLEWNMVEHFFTALIWEFLGDYGVGLAITGGLGGNQSKADVLLALAKLEGRSRELALSVDFACKAFNILRENRNILLHSHTIFMIEGGKPQWRRATGRGAAGHASVEADVADIEGLVYQITCLGKFVVCLVPFINPRPGAQLSHEYPEIFAMPKKLKAPLVERDA